MYQNTTEICTLYILVSCKFSLTVFCGLLRIFYMQDHITYEEYYISFPIWMLFILSCPFALPRASSTMLNRSGASDIFVLFLV